MDRLQQGSSSYKVKYLQRLLNLASVRDRAPGVPLREDGIFGPKTDAAVRAFQGRHAPLRVDGVVGSATWPVLGLQTEREHPVQIFGQPSTVTCWSAAATMLLGTNQSVTAPAANLSGGGLITSTADYDAFARSNGLRLLQFSPDVRTLVGIVRQNPVWIGESGTGWAHAVVLSGVFSDGDNRGVGTLFRIHDPWPVNVGNIYTSFANPIQIMAADGVTPVPAALRGVITR